MRFRRPRALDHLDDDIRDHIERETQENVERGMSPEGARSEALRKFGNVTRVMEDTRAAWTWIWLEQLLQDIRYGGRRLRRNPGFAAVVVFTLALGIGMNTTVFSVVNAVLLRPLAYPNPERLVWIGHYNPHIKRDMTDLGAFFDWREHSHALTYAAAYSPQQSVVADASGATHISCVAVAGDFFTLTGVRPALGSLFGPDEQNVVVLSWDLFRRKFAGDPKVVGSSVNLDSRRVTVVGVLPANFRFLFPEWWLADQPGGIEAYVPLSYSPGRFGNVVAQLRRGVSSKAALAELAAREDHVLKEQNSRQFLLGLGKLRVEWLRDELAGSARPALLVLLAAGTFVLLIECLNIANLLLARGATRRREIAVRAALGAGRSRLIRQLLAESVILALAGGATGLLVARGALAIILRLAPYAIPRLQETTIDVRVLAVTLGISIAAGLAFGLGPALALRRSHMHEALKEGLRASMGGSGTRTRRLLVTGEVAMALILLTGAGLMLKSLWRMTEHAPGFEPEHILLLNIGLAGPQYDAPTARDAYMRELLRRVETLPAVRTAGTSNWVMFAGAMSFPIDRAPGQTHVVRMNIASPGFFEALGMRLIKGRLIRENDSDRAVVLNESMAREVFGAGDPIGRLMPLPKGAKVVGVVADLNYTKLDAPVVPEIFVRNLRDGQVRGGQVAIRTASEPALLRPAVRKVVASIDPTQALTGVETLEEHLVDSIAPRRFNLFLLGTFAAVALLLAVVGIYGVIAYAVAERTREIGVRMTLGARRGQVVGMVLREGVVLALGGVAAGLPAAWGLTRLMASLLYDVQPHDPATFAVVSGVLAATAVVAGLLPALRAARVDPVVALRYE